jgi:dTDP-4-dehydrorhamnose reductase
MITADNTRKVLVLGAAGMLGHAVLRYFLEQGRHSVTGTVRSQASLLLLPTNVRKNVIVGPEVEDAAGLKSLFADVRPEVVINCIGLVKQLALAQDPVAMVSVNSLFPHRMAQLCSERDSRFIHISTDCVFSGSKGMYCEDDTCDATDLYGRSKLLGEVDRPDAVTLRTSIIGRELVGAHGLVEWFLSQNTGVRGYTKAVFSGLTTNELARVMHDFVIPCEQLSGLYHVSADPIDKHSLLQLIARAYERTISVTPDDKIAIDRSLDSTRFKLATGYLAPAWPDLIMRMRAFDQQE